MAELHEEYEGFEKLPPPKRKKKDEDLSLSKRQEKTSEGEGGALSKEPEEAAEGEGLSLSKRSGEAAEGEELSLSKRPGEDMEDEDISLEKRPGKTARGEEISLSRQIERGEEVKLKPAVELKSDLTGAEAFYEDVLRFVTAILDKVADGKENQIDAGEILGWAGKSCDYFLNPVNPDDFVRLVFQHDDYKKNYLYTHSVNVCFMSVRIAFELNFSKGKLRDLVIASLFHDAGMMKVPQDIWNKESRLTRAEYEEVQKHALYGREIFGSLAGIPEVIPLVIGQHHEKADGTGYPGHLTKENIHYLARLVSLVDRYVAQTHTRLWRPRFLPDKVIQYILDYETNSYDPHFMKAMLRQISTFPVGSWVKISSGEIGNVVKVNEDAPMRPVINLIFDREKNRLPRVRTLDLSKQLLIYVRCCIDMEEIQKL